MEFNKTDDFSTEEMMQLFDACVEAQLKGEGATILYLESIPGIGKTQMILAYPEWKLRNGSEFLELNRPKVLVRTNILSQSDSVDFGAPAPDFKAGTLNFLVPDDVLGLAPGDDKYDIVIVFWDELPNANPATLSAWQSVAESGEIRGKKKASNCVYMAAGNRPEDKCGARPLPRSIREGRVITVPMGVSMGRLIKHAEDSEWDRRLINMLQWSDVTSKNLLNDFDPNTKAKVQPSPRGLQKLNCFLEEGVNEQILDALAPGCVGERMWAEIRAFFMMESDLPTRDQIVDDPEGAMLPGDNNPEIGPSGQYAVISNCACFLNDCKKRDVHVETRVFEAYVKYFDRMSDEMTLFALNLCKQAYPDFENTSAWGEAQVRYKELNFA